MHPLLAFRPNGLIDYFFRYSTAGIGRGRERKRGKMGKKNWESPTHYFRLKSFSAFSLHTPNFCCHVNIITIIIVIWTLFGQSCRHNSALNHQGSKKNSKMFSVLQCFCMATKTKEKLVNWQKSTWGNEVYKMRNWRLFLKFGVLRTVRQQSGSFMLRCIGRVLITDNHVVAVPRTRQALTPPTAHLTVKRHF